MSRASGQTQVPAAPHQAGTGRLQTGAVLQFPTSTHRGLAQHPNRALGPKPFGTSQNQFAAS